MTEKDLKDIVPMIALQAQIDLQTEQVNRVFALAIIANVAAFWALYLLLYK